MTSPEEGNPYRSEVAGGAGHDPVSTVIPYKNSAALLAYYLGVFSFLACVPLLGIPFIIMAGFAAWSGWKGLKAAEKNPEARGRVHAWIGIIVGGMCGLVGILMHLSFLVLMIFAAAQN